jgi:small subunit ribosomal protein S5
MNSHKKRRGGRRREQKEFQESVIQIDRVTRVVKGGRRLRFRATVCIGDQKGRVGLGIGKSTEVRTAIEKAITKAKKNLVTVNLHGGTIPHQHRSKFKSAIVFMKPASKGTGIIAGGAIRKVLELAGVKDILTKNLGTDNKLNTAKVTVQALSELKVTPRMEKEQQTTKTTAAKSKTQKPEAKKETKPKAKKESPKKETKKAAPKKKTTTKKSSKKETK